LLHNISTESGSDRVTILAIPILAISRDPVASTTPRGLPARGPRSALGTDLIRKLRHYRRIGRSLGCVLIFKGK